MSSRCRCHVELQPPGARRRRRVSAAAARCAPPLGTAARQAGPCRRRRQATQDDEPAASCTSPATTSLPGPHKQRRTVRVARAVAWQSCAFRAHTGRPAGGSSRTDHVDSGAVLRRQVLKILVRIVHSVPSLLALMYPMALLLRGRGYSAEEGVHLSRGGTPVRSGQGGTLTSHRPSALTNLNH